MNNVIQNRQILSMIGITCWTNKYCTTKKVADVQYIGINNRLSHLITTTQSVHDVKRDEAVSPQPQVSADKRLQLAVPTPTAHPSPINKFKMAKDQPVVTPVAVPVVTDITPIDIRYHLQGVRFGGWVLVVDVLKIDRALQTVWHRLCHALCQQAEQKQLVYYQHEIHYPMVQDDYREHQGLAPAQDAFMGFMFRLLHGDELPKVVFLNDMPKTLSYFGQVHQTVSLLEMVTNVQAKKAFWQMLQS